MKVSASALGLVILTGLLLPHASLAISVDAFGANGEGGTRNGQTFSYLTSTGNLLYGSGLRARNAVNYPNPAPWW